MTATEREGTTARRALVDRWWAPGLLALVLAAAFVGALLVRAGGDASLLVHAGPPWTDAQRARPSLTVQGPDDAFDGQFFYRLGVSPWSTEDEVAGVTNDLPSLRNARWGYGALAWVASGGNPDRVPEALVAVNLAAAFILGAAGGSLARSSGRHRLWGASLILWPGFAYSLSLDTSELVAAALVLSGLAAARSRRPIAAGALLTAAVLTRDTTAVVPLGFLLAGAWTWVAARRRATAVPADRSPSTADPLRWACIGGVPLVAFAAWQLVQRARFGTLPLRSSGDNNLSAPLRGLVDLVRTTALPTTGAEVLRLASAALVIGLIAAAAWWWRRSAAPLPERAALVPAVAVVILLNPYLWSGATAFMRAATEAGVLSILVVLGTRTRRAPAVLVAALGSVWLLTALAQISKLG